MKIRRGGPVSDSVEGKAGTQRAQGAGLLVTAAIVAAVTVIVVRLLGDALFAWD